jgi:hypothetical protein
MTSVESNLHARMNKQFPRTGRCEWCGRTDRKTEYACAGHRYVPNTYVACLLAKADWLELCRSCHQAFDGYVHRRGKKHTAEARTRISKAQKGKKLSTETRARMSAAMYRRWAAKTPEERSAQANRAWQTRRGGGHGNQ